MTGTSSANGSGTTVALVHGAFADSSGWNDVVSQLDAAGVPVQAISNPLRGISFDAAYVRSALQQIPGRVLAVGHSYGGGGGATPPPDARHGGGGGFLAGVGPPQREGPPGGGGGGTGRGPETHLPAGPRPPGNGT